MNAPSGGLPIRRRLTTLPTITIVAIVAALVLCGLLFYFFAGHQTPAGQPPLAELKPQTFTTIESAFNAAKDGVRILLLLSPT